MENQDQIKEKSKSVVVKDDNEGGKVKAAESTLWNALSDTEKAMYEERAKQSNTYGYGSLFILLTLTGFTAMETS